MVSGNNKHHTTHHEVIVRRKDPGGDIHRGCNMAINQIINTCIKKGYYGGWWTNRNLIINISNTILPGTQSSDGDATKPVKSWFNEYPPWENAMEMLKSGKPDNSTNDGPVSTEPPNSTLDI
ncbi:hypothetical protein K469DRAFT_695098 [Zopfia rhizophila CBS 207.26]|uniref:Uncharacterized protein n=1 Tax=Zopfia rhizophila CBS 207.26 TaxID=1314779 RepID=A0A6A6DKH1_9PEZI|nr:hypothetical protein K469DRAFT_695098 [Zopfia rhizophila CBS 207.26]